MLAYSLTSLHSGANEADIATIDSKWRFPDDGVFVQHLCQDLWTSSLPQIQNHFLSEVNIKRQNWQQSGYSRKRSLLRLDLQCCRPGGEWILHLISSLCRTE